MSRFKKCDECGNTIGRVGKDGFRLKSAGSGKMGDSNRGTVGRLKGGEKIVSAPIVYYLCKSCYNFFLAAENNIDGNNYTDVALSIALAGEEGLKTPKEIDKIFDKKNNRKVSGWRPVS